MLIKTIVDFFYHDTMLVSSFSKKLDLKDDLPIEYRFKRINLFDEILSLNVKTKSIEQIKKLKLVILFKLTYFNNLNSKCLFRLNIFKKANRKVNKFINSLLSLRINNDLFTKGQTKEIIIDEENRTYGYKKIFRNEEVTVILNNGYQQVELPINSSMIDILNENKVYKDFVIIPKKSGVILK